MFYVSNTMKVSAENLIMLPFNKLCIYIICDGSDELKQISVIVATFNNISAISWRSVLLVEEIEYPEKTPTCPKSLTNFIT